MELITFLALWWLIAYGFERAKTAQRAATARYANQLSAQNPTWSHTRVRNAAKRRAWAWWAHELFTGLPTVRQAWADDLQHVQHMREHDRLNGERRREAVRNELNELRRNRQAHRELRERGQTDLSFPQWLDAGRPGMPAAPSSAPASAAGGPAAPAPAGAPATPAPAAGPAAPAPAGGPPGAAPASSSPTSNPPTSNPPAPTHPSAPTGTTAGGPPAPAPAGTTAADPAAPAPAPAAPPATDPSGPASSAPAPGSTATTAPPPATSGTAPDPAAAPATAPEGTAATAAGGRHLRVVPDPDPDTDAPATGPGSASDAASASTAPTGESTTAATPTTDTPARPEPAAPAAPGPSAATTTDTAVRPGQTPRVPAQAPSAEAGSSRPPAPAAAANGSAVPVNETGGPSAAPSATTSPSHANGTAINGGSMSDSMEAPNIEAARQVVRTQAANMQGNAANSEQLVNDMLAGGMGNDQRTMSAIARAQELTAQAAAAWSDAASGMDAHQQGEEYANTGIAAKTEFLKS